VELVGEAADGAEAVDAIRRLEPDLVFLDIQMPAMTGFEVIEEIGAERMPAVIFVTAYDEYAINAFDVQAIDYLLKPFDDDRFRRAFERAVASLTGGGGGRDRIERLLGAVRPAPSWLKRVVVREADRVLLVDVGEIFRVSAEGNYVRIHTPGRSHLIRETMSRMESRLDPERFARIHRSDIVRIDAIREMKPWFHGDYLVTLEDGSQLRLSRRYQERLLGE
jgi:two-component system LytT family response regulator